MPTPLTLPQVAGLLRAGVATLRAEAEPREERLTNSGRRLRDVPSGLLLSKIKAAGISAQEFEELL
ncbi:MAG: hypothetical protein IH958_06425 [Chloroflexi bacterium]|nr:hypothetical protein [Chloroflexota bacterium]